MTWSTSKAKSAVYTRSKHSAEDGLVGGWRGDIPRLASVKGCMARMGLGVIGLEDSTRQIRVGVLLLRRGFSLAVCGGLGTGALAELSRRSLLASPPLSPHLATSWSY